MGADEEQSDWADSAQLRQVLGLSLLTHQSWYRAPCVAGGRSLRIHADLWEFRRHKWVLAAIEQRSGVPQQSGFLQEPLDRNPRGQK
jgi:hypothetical protein